MGSPQGARLMLRLSVRGRSRRKSVTMPSWAFGLMAAGSAALGIAMFLVISALAVLLLPVVLLAGGVTAFVMRKRIERVLSGAGLSTPRPGVDRRHATRKPPGPDIEDVEYRVIEEPARDTSRR